jgi:hypothetical protein
LDDCVAKARKRWLPGNLFNLFSEPFSEKAGYDAQGGVSGFCSWATTSGNDASAAAGYATFRVDKLNRTRVRRIV